VNRTVMMVIRAVLGLIVLFALLYVVTNWWRDYRSAQSSRKAATTTESVSPAAGEEGSAQKPAESSPADKSTAQSDTVVVLVDGLNLRVEPANGAKSVRGLNKGEKLVLLKKDGKWYQVQTAEGDEGWISSSPSYTRVESR